MAKEQNKKTYGEFGNVKLTDEDLAVLQERYPQDYADYIEAVDGYCESTGKKYKNYRATIQNWIRRDKKSGKLKRAAAGQISRQPTYDINEISRKAAQNTEIKY